MKLQIEPSRLEQYRAQLNQWVAALAANDSGAVAVDAAERYQASDVDLFTEGNVAKRVDILNLQLQALKAAFEDLDELIGEYIQTRPQEAFAAGPADASTFLRWLGASFELTPEQADHVACRQARFDVEDAARANRAAHVRFQERLSVAPSLASERKRLERLQVHLNPARSLVMLCTREFLDEESELPGNVVFFAVGTQIHSAVLDEPVPYLLELLEEKPLSLAQCASRASLSGPEELEELTARLAEVGLLAF